MEGIRWNACISYFNSLKNFYVHNIKDKQIIQKISTSLQSLDDKLLSIVSQKPGDLVAAKHESDGLWYRAKILDIKENACHVQLIDYGNKELTSKIKKLPKKLRSYCPMAYNCILDEVNNEEQKITNNTDIYNIVNEFFTSIEVTLKFLNNAEPYAVKMKWDDRNIKIILDNIITRGITFETYHILKEFDELGTKIEVNVTHIESINEFYVEMKNNEEIKKIEHELVHGTYWEPLTEYKFGKMAIAKNVADDRWYRVRILEVHDQNEYTCYLLDYGIKAQCIDFYEAVGYLKLAPPITKRCSLYMPDIKRKMLFNILSQCFYDEMDMSKNRETIISIVKSGEPSVVELFVDNLNVATVIRPTPVIISKVFHLNSIKVQIDTPKRSAILNELKDIKTLTQVKTPKIDQIYGAHINDEWYRVLFKGKKNQEFDVMLVDIGGALKKVKQLYALPNHIEKPKYLYMNCSLELDDEHFSSQKFRNLAKNNTKFTMFVLKHNAVNGHHIHLLLDNKDVTSMIRRDEGEE